MTKGWYGNRQQHSLASKGISVREISRDIKRGVMEVIQTPISIATNFKQNLHDYEMSKKDSIIKQFLNFRY